MFALNLVLLSSSLLFSDALYVDTLLKCSVKDSLCSKDLLQNVIHDIGDTGIKELNILPLEPMKLTNISITVLDSISLTVTDGLVKGLKNCIVNKFSINMDELLANVDISCDILTIEVEFLFDGSNQLLQTIFGSATLNGQGKAILNLEKISFNGEIPFLVIKKEDGETYTKLITDKTKYDFDIQNAIFDVKSLTVGGNDLSQLFSSYLKNNWKFALKSFGRDFGNVGLNYIMSFAQEFFNIVSSKNLFKEDMTPYVKN